MFSVKVSFFFIGVHDMEWSEPYEFKSNIKSINTGTAQTMQNLKYKTYFP